METESMAAMTAQITSLVNPQLAAIINPVDLHLNESTKILRETYRREEEIDIKNHSRKKSAAPVMKKISVYADGLLFETRESKGSGIKTCRGCANLASSFPAPEYYECKINGSYCVENRNNELICGKGGRRWEKSSTIRRFFNVINNQLTD